MIPIGRSSFWSDVIARWRVSLTHAQVTCLSADCCCPACALATAKRSQALVGQPFHQRFHVRIPISNEHGVVGYDNREIVRCHDDILVCIGQDDVFRSRNHGLAHDDIVITFRTNSPCQRGMGSHVLPTAGQEDAAGIARLLHDLVIDRALRHLGKQLAQDLFACRRIPGFADLREQGSRLRQVRVDLPQDRFRLPRELPGIPAVSPFVHVSLSDLQFGFFRESRDPSYLAARKVNGLAQLLPANQRAGGGGFHSEGHQLIRVQLQEGRCISDGRIELDRRAR